MNDDDDKRFEPGMRVSLEPDDNDGARVCTVLEYMGVNLYLVRDDDSGEELEVDHYDMTLIA